MVFGLLLNSQASLNSNLKAIDKTEQTDVKMKVTNALFIPAQNRRRWDREKANKEKVSQFFYIAKFYANFYLTDKKLANNFEVWIHFKINEKHGFQVRVSIPL